MVQLGSKNIYNGIYLFISYFLNSQILLLDDCHLSYKKNTTT
jgi:hypothetical protein